ncbi:Zinc carboxypeptidase [Seminavis robusta]|uniref:Zinc carboxypeptidase n=1 Tax=Seminavis robusta TaxID=568900 RepID=A0A9N8DBQ3_9STRA|nr:Zinc carboxypeptidase [Seminavis robusta]|eukprot:Sro48_g028410.1 Zinc carboxypeptidase (794) ;mRNA; f:139649-142125
MGGNRWSSSSSLLALMASLLLLLLQVSCVWSESTVDVERRSLRNLGTWYEDESGKDTAPAASTTTTTTTSPKQNNTDAPAAVTTSAPAVPYPQPYQLWEPKHIKDQLFEWAEYFPEFVRLTNAQDQYGLPTAGNEHDCPYDDDVPGCRNYIMTLQDYEKHPEGSDSSNRLPEVFWSGELHGNERVGPTAVMQATHLLLLAASCQAKPRHFDTSRHSFNEKTADWASQKKAAKDCRLLLEKEHGMDDAHRQWLARILSTRRIVVVPTANALGYYMNLREELRNDPNRDFPYDVENAKDCMKTIAGRTLNEIFREHMFQLSLTFHAGMEVVGYEWGAPTWMGHLSPDDTAQATIGRAYSEYGGTFKGSTPYNYGTMNDLVYYVRGGFEDWAYAGSWDPDRVIACQPTTHGGYDAAKTKYDNSTLRVFNMLVETSNRKIPPASTLGTSKDVFNNKTAGNGHVSRNIRLSLMASDVVQPYVAMVGVNELTLTDDVVPMVQDEGRSCQDTKAVMVPGNNNVTYRWTVGGAFDIDSTELWYAKWDDVPADVLDCVQNTPSRENLEQHFTKATLLGPSSGTGFFSHQGPVPAPQGKKKEALGPVFSGTMDVSSFHTHDKLVVLATARVDQNWQTMPADYAPKLPPQSHIVNARTNPDWHHQLPDGKVIQGRLDWFSIPLTVVVGDYQDSVGTQAGRQVGTVELSNRFGETTGDYHAGMTPSAPSSSSTTGDNNNKKKGPSMTFLVVIVVVVCSFVVYKRFSGPKYKMDYDTTYQDNDEDDDEYGMRGASYSDKPKEMELT